MIDPQSSVPITEMNPMGREWSHVFSKRDISENNMLKNDKRELAENG